MMEKTSTRGEYLRINRAANKKSLVFGAIIVASMFLVSCFAAIPVAIRYARNANQTKAQAEMPVSAEKVYSTAVEMAKEKDLKILKQKDDKMYIEVTDGVQTGSLKAKPIGSDRSEVTVVASLPSQEGEEREHRKAREKELTLRIINRVCDRLKVQCTIEKG